VEASVRNTIRIGVFSTSLLVAVLFADKAAHAEDANQAATPAPEPGAGDPPAPEVAAPDTPAPPPIEIAAPADPPADPAPNATPAADDTPVVPPAPPAAADTTPPDTDLDPAPAGTGTNTNQDAEVTTTGGAVANTGTNAAGANGTGTGAPTTPGGSTAGVNSGPANGQGTVDNNISQEVNATVTENGRVVVVQVAIIVNIGIGVAGSGGNTAGSPSAQPPVPTSSVGTIVGSNPAGAGTGPTPAQIISGGSNATGNTGTTQVTQSIVLTGNDVAQQLAAVLNIGVGVANSGLNYALAAVSSNNAGAPSSVTFVTMGGGANITAGPASALGNRSTSAVFQVVTVSASGDGVLLVIQRAIIVNFGLALANSGLNVAGGGALTGAVPDTQAAQQLLLALLSANPAALDDVGSGGSLATIQSGGAHAIGNDTATGIHQQVTGSVTGDQTAQAIQDAWVGNFGVGVANSGGNVAGGLGGIDAASFNAARSALQAFLAGLTGVGDPLQGLDASFNLGSSLLQLHGDVSGTESLLGIAEPGTTFGPDDAQVIIRQITAVLNIGLALSDSGHNTAVAVTATDGTTVSGPEAGVLASTLIRTGDATAVGNHFAATVCQAIGDSVTCAPDDPEPPTKPTAPPVKVLPTEVTNPGVSNPFTPAVGSTTPATIVPASLPFTGSPIGAELAAGSGVLIAGMLMARRRRSGART
jgi:hypothetical protein